MYLAPAQIVQPQMKQWYVSLRLRALRMAVLRRCGIGSCVRQPELLPARTCPGQKKPESQSAPHSSGETSFQFLELAESDSSVEDHRFFFACEALPFLLRLACSFCGGFAVPRLPVVYDVSYYDMVASASLAICTSSAMMHPWRSTILRQSLFSMETSHRSSRG